MTRTEKLLEYVRATKKAAAIRAHQGEEDYRYWEGKMVACQEIENLLVKLVEKEGKEGKASETRSA